MNCKNCQHELHEHDDYCPNCGAKVIRNRLTFKNLFLHISETYFNTDNKLLRTFLKLFTKPEEVIVGYINGVRKKYVDVIGYFALAITLSGLQIFIVSKIGIDTSFYDTATETGKVQQRLFDNFYSLTKEYQSLVMMLYVPFYAGMAFLIFRKYRMYNYTEFLVIFLYCQAHLSIVFAFITPLATVSGDVPLAIVGSLIIPAQIAYYIYALKKVFKLSAKQMFVRTILFVLLLFLIMIVFSILVAVYMYQTGMLEQMKQAQ